MNERIAQSPLTPEEQANFRLLKTIEQYPEFSQRELAEALGMSLGRTNYVIRALVDRGFLKLERFIKGGNKLTKTAYLLTPSGLKHRLALTQGYIERKKAEYEALKSELTVLQQEFHEEQNCFPQTYD